MAEPRGAAVDPTENVSSLVSAEARRQDDLREAEARSVREIIGLRADYEEKLRVAESKRIDAIRAVDVAAVSAAAAAEETRSSALAVQVVSSAEALRNQVETTAKAAATDLAARVDPLQKAIEELRQTQYQQQGEKSQKTETRANLTFGQSVIIVAILLISTIIGIYAAVHRSGPSAPSSAVVCTAIYHPAPCPQP